MKNKRDARTRTEGDSSVVFWQGYGPGRLCTAGHDSLKLEWLQYPPPPRQRNVRFKVVWLSRLTLRSIVFFALLCVNLSLVKTKLLCWTHQILKATSEKVLCVLMNPSRYKEGSCWIIALG